MQTCCTFAQIIKRNTMQDQLSLFDGQLIRYVWDENEEKYFFSVVDIISVLTESNTPRRYWSDLKHKLQAEGSELYDKIVQLKITAADGKKYLTDMADTEQVFRIIQSVPSKKAEPFKLWLAQLGRQRLEQMQDPEQSIEMAVRDYRRLGYSEEWINQRIKTIEIRKALTDEWKRGGMKEETDYAVLTDIISKAWSGMTTRQYKNHKGLRKESLRDNMTNVELMLNGLAEAAATELSKRENPKGFVENAQVAERGGNVAHVAREQLEKELGDTVISKQRAVNFTAPHEELPFKSADDKKQ